MADEKVFRFRRQLIRNQRVIAGPGDEVTAEELGQAMFNVLESQGFGVIDEASSEKAEPEENTGKTSKDVEIKATSAAEELAEEEDIDLAEVEGTGKNGKVTKGDVKGAIE